MPEIRHLIPALFAGLVSCGLFLLVFGIGLGFPFMFLPALPLFYIALSNQQRQAQAATLIAAVLIATTGGFPISVMFLLFLALPSLYMAWQALHWRLNSAGGREWFPLGLIMTTLTLYACAFVALATLFYVSEPGGLPKMIADNMRGAFTDLPPEYSDVVDAMADKLVFMILPITIWLWGLSLYAHAWLANRALAKKKRQQRDNFSIKPFHMPTWMLGFLAICALASLVGSESLSFLGKSTLLTLMLPYFFLGTSVIHASTKSLVNNRFFLFFVYVAVFTLFWPALILSGVGIWQQIKHLSAAQS